MGSSVIKYNGTRSFSLGDILYRAEAVNEKVFRSVCRVCEGKKTLTVNGITFACPCCSTEDEITSVTTYGVKKYIVCGISENSNVSFEREELFLNETRTICVSLCCADNYVTFCEGISFDSSQGFNNDGEILWYESKEKAEEAVQKLNEQEKEKLNLYNLKHGTKFNV